MSVYFVTGTDTGVGKTVVTAALAVVLGGRGSSVGVVKPAQTGVRSGEPGDIDEIRRLAGPLPAAEGVRLPEPMAPVVAARMAGKEPPTLSDQRDLVLDMAREHDVVLVEGSGGVTVELGKAFTLLDIAGMVKASGEPVQWVVVARAGLGTLNHSNLTVWAVQQRDFFVQGIVIGSWPTAPGLVELSNREELSLSTGVPVLGALPANASLLEPSHFRAQARDWIPYVSLD